MLLLPPSFRLCAVHPASASLFGHVVAWGQKDSAALAFCVVFQLVTEKMIRCAHGGILDYVPRAACLDSKLCSARS